MFVNLCAYRHNMLVASVRNEIIEASKGVNSVVSHRIGRSNNYDAPNVNWLVLSNNEYPSDSICAIDANQSEGCETDMAYNTLRVEALYKALEAAQTIAVELNAIDRTKLTESEDKFLSIRLPRIIHITQETTLGKSMSVNTALEKVRKSVVATK